MQHPKDIQYIRPQERVSAAVTNRPIGQIAAQTAALRRRLDSLATGEAVLLRDVPIERTLQAGCPVYWDTTTSQFKAAYASSVQSCGEFVSASQSDCLGLIYQKTTDTAGDIVLFGVVDLPGINNYLPSGTGRFYLGATPGALTFDGPAVKIPVGFRLGARDACDTSSSVFVNPEYTGTLFPHSHYSVTLKQSLWETPTATAPTGAVYQYNIAEDPELKNIFPPIPLESISCTIDWDGQHSPSRLIETEGSKEIAVNTENAYIKVTNTGIWWMSSALSPVITQTDETYTHFKITIHFSRVRYNLKDTFVTSLQPDNGQPFEFVNCQGDAATRGDLYARFVLQSDSIEADTYTGTAIQGLTTSWKQEVAPTINGIATNGSILRISSNTEPIAYRGNSYHHGLVQLNVALNTQDVELAPQIIKLDEALESEYQNITYLALPYSRPSTLKLKIEVPASIGTAQTLNLKLRLQCLALATGTFPALTLRYIRIPSTTGSVTPYLAPTAIGLNTAKPVTLSDTFCVTSSEFQVTRGDTVILMLSRTAPDGYTANAGIIRMNGILNEETL